MDFFKLKIFYMFNYVAWQPQISMTTQTRSFCHIVPLAHIDNGTLKWLPAYPSGDGHITTLYNIGLYCILLSFFVCLFLFLNNLFDIKAIVYFKVHMPNVVVTSGTSDRLLKFLL